MFERIDQAEIMRELRNSELAHEYQRLIDYAKRNQTSVVLLSVNTSVVQDSPEASKAFYRSIFVDVDSAIVLMQYHTRLLQELAQTHPNVYFADTSRNLLGKFDDDLYLDVVHFTTKGDAMMAGNVYRQIEPLLLGKSSLQCAKQHGGDDIHQVQTQSVSGREQIVRP